MLCMKSQRDGQTSYVRFDGMDEETVRRLMTELGHTEIEVITEEEYQTATARP